MKLKGEIFIIVSAACFGFMPIFAKFAYAGGAKLGTVLFFRFFLALIFVWSYIFIRGIKFRISKKQLMGLIIQGGIFYSGSALTLFASYKYISAGLSEILMFTYPAWVLCITKIIFKEKLSINKVRAIILSIVGITISVYTKGQIFSTTGILLALSGALFYAFYVAFIGHGEFEELDSIVMTGYILLGATGVFLVFALGTGGIKLSMPLYSWLNITLLALFSTTIAIFAFCSGAKKIGTSKAAIVSTIEPVFTFIFGYLLLGEKVTVFMLVGAVFIISAIITLNLFSDKVEVAEATRS